MTDEPPYETGFGRPPREHQFKPGQSGNPKGRSKGKPTTGELFRRTANELVTVTNGGKQIKITKAEVVIRRLFQKAMEGDIVAQKYVLGAAGQQHASDIDDLAGGAEGFDLDDSALERMLARFDHLRPGKKPK